MKKMDFASRLARRQHISKAQAADQVDGVVHQILRRLRAGKPAPLPGLGVLRPDKQSNLRISTPKRPAGKGK